MFRNILESDGYGYEYSLKLAIDVEKNYTRFYIYESMKLGIKEFNHLLEALKYFNERLAERNDNVKY